MTWQLGLALTAYLIAMYGAAMLGDWLAGVTDRWQRRRHRHSH